MNIMCNIKLKRLFRFAVFYKHSNLIIILTFLVFTSGCSKLIKIDAPYTSINKDNVFNADGTATAVVTDILAQMSNQNFSSGGYVPNLFLFAGLASDEITLFAKDNSTLNVFYYNSLNENTDIGFWNPSYSTIFAINLAIDGLNSTTDLTDGVKLQLLGEAKFLRAFYYFYLINLYGDVPLVLGIDPLKNATLSRSPIEKVYAQIIQDLKDAQLLLSEDYRSGNVLLSTTERIRPNKWAAKALLSRVYLYQKDYQSAENLASEVINNSSLFQLSSLKDVFLKNNNECIWQLQNVNNTRGNTGEGNIFILPSSGPNNDNFPVYLSGSLVQSFEASDQRRNFWIDSVKVDSNLVYYYPYKYKSGVLTPDNQTTEYEMVLRLGEQFLIRSEARAYLENITGAKDDLNTIRKRAGLPETLASTKNQLIAAILHERQVELFTEWGHRWLDLKRTNSIDNVMQKESINKGTTWNSSWSLWPISLPELLADPNLTQNEGY